MEMKLWRSALVLALGGTALLAFGAASAVKKPGLGDTVVAQGPFLDPKTNSYFELRNDLSRSRSGWWAAKTAASSKYYKGRKGRLAVVKDLETLEFIRERFRLNSGTWIGLIFYCKFRKAVWVTGEVQPSGASGMWAPQWFRNRTIRCRNQNISKMPVYLTSQRKGEVFWQASGPAKAFLGYFVEYPAENATEKTSAKTEN